MHFFSYNEDDNNNNIPNIEIDAIALLLTNLFPSVRANEINK